MIGAFTWVGLAQVRGLKEWFTVITTKIDYYKITVFSLDFRLFYSEYFEEYLGPIREREYGGRGFTSSADIGVNGILYFDPVNLSKDGLKYFTLELKGQDCSCVPLEVFQVLENDRINKDMNIRYKRLDVAWDGVDFSPSDFYGACVNNQVRTFSSRSSVRYIEAPYELAEDGREGTSTAYLGSISSERMVRVYDLHGPVRLEFQVKGEWAEGVVPYILKGLGVDALNLYALEALRQYVDVLLDFWVDFVGSVDRASVRVYSAKEKTIERIEAWIISQVAPSLVLLQGVYGEVEFWERVVSSVSMERMKRYMWLYNQAEGVPVVF